MAKILSTRQRTAKTGNRSGLYAVSENAEYLAQLEHATRSFYQTKSFCSPDEALGEISRSSPCTLIVDSALGGMTGTELVNRVREAEGGAELPIVFTALSSEREMARELESFSGVKTLEKPYRKTELLGVISGQVNSAVEASWENIEPVQKSALKQTLESFNSLADLISEGSPVEYSDVSGNCEPLLEAVKNQNFKDILKGIQGHDNYSYVHSMRVATLLSLFGDAIGIKGDEHMTLTAGGLLHDVGKMVIPHEVLNKAGKLDESEFAVMKSHVTHTLDYLGKTETLPKGVMIIAGQHHEKIDGSGYPLGLAGSDLNQLARMATIIDIFSALTDRRVYKPPMEPEKALSIMNDMKGHIDMGFLAIFKEMLLDSVRV